MRFLILTQYFPPEIGAPQTRLAAFAAELLRRGHEVEVVTAMPHHLVGRVYGGYRGKIYVREQWHGIPVHRTWIYAATGVGVRRILNYLSFCATSLIALMRVKKPDYVFVESPPLFLSLPGWFAARRAKAKLVFNVADLWPDSVHELGIIREGPMLRLAGQLETWTYRRASYVNAVTLGIAARLRNGKAVEPAKILYLPNGIDTRTFRPYPPNLELAAQLGLTNKTIFLYAGTHGIAQGLEHVIDAAALVDPRDISVLFVGAGPTKPFLVERAKRLNLQNVVFRDPVPVEQVPAYYSIACASIVPLVRNELFKGARPSKILSSLACGVPVMYCGEGEGADLVRSAEAGIVVEPENPQALAQAMKDLSARPDRRDLMAKAARRVAESDHGWPRIVDTWLAGLGAGAKQTG